MSRHSWSLEPEATSLGGQASDGAADKIDSPGEYKLASSLAPACCGPHLSEPRPGPRGSGLCISAPHTFFSPILAISPLCGPGPFNLFTLRQSGTNEVIDFSADRQRSVSKPIA